MEEATAVQQEYSAAREIWKKFRKSRTAVSGLAAILFLCAVAGEAVQVQFVYDVFDCNITGQIPDFLTDFFSYKKMVKDTVQAQMKIVSGELIFVFGVSAYDMGCIVV